MMSAIINDNQPIVYISESLVVTRERNNILHVHAKPEQKITEPALLRVIRSLRATILCRKPDYIVMKQEEAL